MDCNKQKLYFKYAKHNPRILIDTQNRNRVNEKKNIMKFIIY